MTFALEHFIGGDRIACTDGEIAVINPSTEATLGKFAPAGPDLVDRAVAAAVKAFPAWSTTAPQDRHAALLRIADAYEARIEDLAQALSAEMGAPIDFARKSQAGAGLNHLRAFARALENYSFRTPVGPEAPDQAILHEPVGVAALITPWNWPLNQIALKVGAALAAGCTMVLKPSEISPMTAQVFAEIIEAADLPTGVFNMVQGDGAVTGSALVAHPDVAIVSFTGSTRAGVAISQSAAPDVKRVSLELGGKSPSIVFADADVEKAVRWTATFCFNNTGQSCNAATRLLVERSVYDKAMEIAKQTAEAQKVGPASASGDHIGPLSSPAQFEKVQGLIGKAIEEGATVLVGGAGRPDALPEGLFARPTIFADVTPEQTIFREEVFGPVLTMTPFDTEEEAIALANDTEYGLSAYLHSQDPARVQRVGAQLRAGMVQANSHGRAPGTPFGGYRRSGIGREGGRWGIEEFLEVKLVTGWPVSEAEPA
ncbi:MAG: aldehyde dehydrogenase family protein [Rhodobacteraceae bacterium]|nr:aldehyde dehydrogenase family protein [Paracoccaceae bacterium]